MATAGAVVGYGVTAALSNITLAGAGAVSTFDGYLKGIITEVVEDAVADKSRITVKVVSRVSSSGEETMIDYAEGDRSSSFKATDSIFFVDETGSNTGTLGSTGTTPTDLMDWYDQQTLGLTNSKIYWKTIAPKPLSSNFVLERNGKNDEMHVAVVDDLGLVTGIQGNILEKHVGLSKAKDTISSVNSPQKFTTSSILQIFLQISMLVLTHLAADAYHGTTPVATGFDPAFASGFEPISTGDGLWGLGAQGVTFSAIGNATYTLNGGVDYSASGGMKAELSDMITSYSLFSNRDEIQVDYLIMGPGCTNEFDSQAKANYLISIAGSRKDCVAVIGPHRGNVVNVTNPETQTENLINYFSTLAVFIICSI